MSQPLTHCREEKEVIVWRAGEEEEGEEGEEGEERVVPYDHLILCTGLQFTPPAVVENQSGENPLIYDANEGLGVADWVQRYVQSHGQP